MARWTPILAYVLTAVGILHVAHQVTSVRLFSSLGFALVAAPLPQFFPLAGSTTKRKIILHADDRSRTALNLTLDSKTFSKVKGPTARREAYFHAIGNATGYPQPFVSAFLRNAFCFNGRLSRELGLNELRHLTVEVQVTKPSAFFGVECKR